MRIVIPGGSGQVGHILARYFHARGHEVIVLSRRRLREPWQVLDWNAAPEALDGAAACINLAGRSVNCRYHARNREEILRSRVETTRRLAEVIANLRNPPNVWLNASTATIYRHALDRAMYEYTGELGGNEPGAPNTWNFSIEVATSWERAFFEKKLLKTRQVAMRSAITFSADRGGAFDILLGLVRHGLGGVRATGSSLFRGSMRSTSHARSSF